MIADVTPAVRGAVPRRGRLRPPSGEASLGRRLRLPRLRRYEGLGAQGRPVRAGVRGLRAPDVGGQRGTVMHRTTFREDLVPRRSHRGHAFQRDLGAAASGAAGYRKLQVSLASAAEAASGDGRSGPEFSAGDRGGRRGLDAVPRKWCRGRQVGTRPQRAGKDPFWPVLSSCPRTRSPPHPAERDQRLQWRLAPGLHCRRRRARGAGHH